MAIKGEMSVERKHKNIFIASYNIILFFAFKRVFKNGSSTGIFII